MPLTALPTEILILLPLFIDNIETFINAAATCHKLRNALYTATPNTILRLAAASAPTFFSPHPHYLVAMTASQAGKWALGDEARTAQLQLVLEGGIDRLYRFCLKTTGIGITLSDIRNMYESRFSVINPLSDKIDKMAGYQWEDTPDFWNGGVSEPATLRTEPDRATLQLLIYGELFGESMNASLQLEQQQSNGTGSVSGRRSDGNLACFDLRTRLRYITYCVPQYDCTSYKFLTGESRAEGPSERDQSALDHILNCRRWRTMWGAAIREVLYDGSVEDFPDEEYYGDEHWRLKLLRDAIWVQGLEGLQLVTVPAGQLDSGFVDKLKWIKGQVDQLSCSPAWEMVGECGVYSNVPDPSGELSVCLWGFLYDI